MSRLVKKVYWLIRYRWVRLIIQLYVWLGQTGKSSYNDVVTRVRRLETLGIVAEWVRESDRLVVVRGRW